MSTGIYCSTYCNFGHDVETGKPIDHECIIIPPEALAAEMGGDYERAIELMRGKSGKMLRGKRIKPQRQDSLNAQLRDVANFVTEAELESADNATHLRVAYMLGCYDAGDYIRRNPGEWLDIAKKHLGAE
jgi:hypothetical protein